MSIARGLVYGGAAVLLAALVSGCGTSSPFVRTETERVPQDTILVARADSTTLRPEVARLYALEAELLAARDSSRTGRLLNRAMSELALLLRADPQALEDDAVRDLYGGLTAEYRRFHGYAPDPDSLQMARGSIFAVRSRLFASLGDVNNPLLEEAPRGPVSEVEQTPIAMTSNRLVNQSIEHLQEEPDKHVERWLRRVQVYGPMIDHIFAEVGVPPELKYLAMIESGLNPQARSWAGAEGMWQFMASTGQRYGLTINAWVDERQDPEKATRAAARHLKDLYQEFENWHLAMAAYNCGAGCVRRARRRADAEDPSFWDAYDYLPRETRGYIPMFIAASRIMQDPAGFGFEAAPPTSTFSYDLVSVPGSMLSINTIATLAGADPNTIRSLNPELRRGRIPPSKDRYSLRIPLGSYPRFAWNYADLSEAQKQPATTYTVRSGDTLSEIAVRFGTSTDALRRMNGLDGPLIRQGQQLVVPVQDYSGALITQEQEGPLRVQYGTAPPVRPLDAIDTGTGRASASTASTDEAPSSDAIASAEDASASSNSEVSAHYQVQRGDTLGGIAQRFGATVEQLRAWNDLDDSRIYPGQRLRIAK